MGRYLGKSKGVVGEIAVVGVKTRARAALAMAATATSSPVKKIKKVSKSSTSSYTFYQLRNRRRNLSAPENLVERGTTTSSSEVIEVVGELAEIANCSSSEVITSSDFPPSCCSSNNDDEDDQSSSSEIVKDRLEISITDPEVESAEASSRCFDCHRTVEAREATKSDDQELPTTKLPDAKSTVQIKMPSNSDIEEFFAAAEKDLQKRFIDKYNFDIVKDEPLEGRYEWVPIKP